MKHITQNQFIQNCYQAFKDGKLDAINQEFRNRASEISLEDLKSELNDIPAFQFFLRNVRPLEGEYAINWTPDILTNAEPYILTNLRFIYLDKSDRVQIIRNPDIKSVKVTKGPLKAKLWLQFKDGKEIIIKMTAVPNQNALELALD